MKPIYSALAVAAISLGLAGVAMAGEQDTGTKNPISRGGKDPFHTGPLYATPRSGGTDLGALGRPTPRGHAAQVNPVPEPSQWAMMIAGLALVGFIVRRNRSQK
jgi:hypothetical protein